MAVLDTCVILNGPPNSGKDTLGHLLGDYGFKCRAMKDQLYIETAKYFGIQLEKLIIAATDRALKEHPWHRLKLGNLELSPRDALIHVSEKCIKPRYGDAYFGQLSADKCLEAGEPLVVFTDGGFASEITPLLITFNSVVVFRLYRNGCTFDGDSRSYLEGFDHTYDLQLEDGNPDAAVQEIITILADRIPLQLAS